MRERPPGLRRHCPRGEFASHVQTGGQSDARTCGIASSCSCTEQHRTPAALVAKHRQRSTSASISSSTIRVGAPSRRLGTIF